MNTIKTSLDLELVKNSENMSQYTRVKPGVVFVGFHDSYYEPNSIVWDIPKKYQQCVELAGYNRACIPDVGSFLDTLHDSYLFNSENGRDYFYTPNDSRLKHIDVVIVNAGYDYDYAELESGRIPLHDIEYCTDSKLPKLTERDWELYPYVQGFQLFRDMKNRYPHSDFPVIIHGPNLAMFKKQAEYLGAEYLVDTKAHEPPIMMYEHLRMNNHVLFPR